MPPSRPRSSVDAGAFADAVFSGRPFVGSAAVKAGIITPHDLRVRFTRMLPGIYQTRGVEPDAAARVRAAWLWAPPGTALAGSAAALLHGDRIVASEEARSVVDLYLPRTARAPRGIRIHPLRKPLGCADLIEVAHMRCTSVERTALDLARWGRDPTRAIVAVDAVCNATETPVETVARHARTLRGLHGLGSALEMLAHCDHRADSPSETRLRLIFLTSSLPKPEPQVKIADSCGRHIVKADLAYREQKVAMFYDGEGHLQREQRDWDSGVTARLFDEGWLDLRVTAGMMRDPATILRRVAEMLRRQGYRPN